MGRGTDGAFLEGPDVLHPIGSHQGPGGIVEVDFDFLKGGGQRVIHHQVVVEEVATKIIQFGVHGKIVIIRGEYLHVQLPVMVESPRQGGEHRDV